VTSAGQRRASAALGYYTEALGFSGSAFALLRDLIAERTGQYFDESKRDLLADKLSDLLLRNGLNSFLDYYYLLRYGADAEVHWTQLLDRLALPETYFWRQADQIEAVPGVLAPRHAAAAPGRPFRIWSAACCSGEEPLSLALALEKAGWFGRLDIEIVATDVSPALVARARTGVFPERSFRALPEALRTRYFEKVEQGWRIDPALLARVRWETANLLDPAAVAEHASADVIFCRNVFIYFSDAAIRRVAEMFAQAMPPAGHLFLGASESLVRFGTELALVEVGGAFAYARGVVPLTGAAQSCAVRVPRAASAGAD
jgi:chemotaxis protein methyltransferase CheR